MINKLILIMLMMIMIIVKHSVSWFLQFFSFYSAEHSLYKNVSRLFKDWGPTAVLATQRRALIKRRGK